MKKLFTSRKRLVNLKLMYSVLCLSIVLRDKRLGWGCTYELGHEGNHEVEKTDGLDESETQNGVGEQLATEGGVAGNTVQESGEDETDTDTSTSQTDSGGTHTQVLGDLDEGVGHLRAVGASLLLEGGASGGVDDGGALHGLDGAGLGHACGKKVFSQYRSRATASWIAKAQLGSIDLRGSSIDPQSIGPMTFEGNIAICGTISSRCGKVCPYQ